jgi:2-epi-5-epi-valiolone synthase
MLTLPEDNGENHFVMGVDYHQDIVIEFADVFSFLRNSGDVKKIVFIDPVVLANQDLFLEVESIDPKLLLVPTNLHEANKDIDSLKSILDVLESHGIGRRADVVCAVGGGALLDTVALAASIYRRGIAIVKVPTTLLGIVDASIGIKTGINFLGQRNRLGSYHFDYRVIADPKLMAGLHRSIVRQGLGEILKIAVIKSRTLFDYVKLYLNQLEDIKFYETSEGMYILRTSIQLMLEELHENPREDNLMRCVDYGHSFSPLVEMESIKRTGFRSIPHGYAVAYDCVLTATISWQRGFLSQADYNEILSLFFSFDFGFNNEIYLDSNLMWASFLEMTKHRGGNQNLPIPVSLGSYAFIQDVTFDEMQRCLIILQDIVNK